MIRGRKGQSSTIGTTIAIVLGIALVVFLIWGFSTNWAMFSSTSGAFSGKTNLDSIRNACASQCNAGFVTEYCEVQKKVILANGTTQNLKCPQVPGVGENGCPNPDINNCRPFGDEQKNQQTT